MAEISLPFVSIITVNFNGKFFLKPLFDSIKKLNYPQDKLQIIMVDNNSKDDSVSFVKENYKFVEILKNDKNLGFAGGNNAGLKIAKGSLIAFINNDCVVEPNWLINMVNFLQEKEEKKELVNETKSKLKKENNKIGAVGSKVLFYFKYIPIKFVFKNLNFEDFAGEIREINIINKCDEFKEITSFANKSIKYLQGFLAYSKDKDGNVIRKIKNNAILGIPIVSDNNDLILKMQISVFGKDNFLNLFINDKDQVEIFEDFDVKNDFNKESNENKKNDLKLEDKIYQHEKEIKNQNEYDKESFNLKFNLNHNSYKNIFIKISKEKFKYAKNIINSAGSIINKTFYAKEIGYETFEDEFNENIEPFEVFAIPGSSFLVKRDVIDEISLFDEKFFTYYEDIDFFWRAKLKGWRFFIEPKSITRHFHCGSGEEWSYNFTYYVLRNRLLMIYKCGWWLAFLKNYLIFSYLALYNFIILILAKIRRINLNRIDIKIRLRIFFEFFILIILYFGKRMKIRLTSKVSDNEIKMWQKDF